MSRTILIVDDEQGIRDVFSQLILMMYSDTNAGDELSIRTAEDGSKAVAASLNDPPSLILMDIDMPVLDGIDAFYRIKENNNNVAVNTVFVTGYATDGVVKERMQKALRDGALGYFSKPIGMADLRGIIEQYVLGDRSPGPTPP